MGPLDWQVEDGQEALQVLAAFEAFVRREGVVSATGNLRVMQSLDGKAVVADDLLPIFSGAFKVGLRGLESVTVSPGFVNLTMPFIDGVRLDGTEKDGNPSRDGIPALSIKGGPDPDTRRSYVCIQVINGGEAETGFDPEDEEALTMVHLRTLAKGVADGPGYPEAGDGVGIKPVAQIAWDSTGKRPLSVLQMVWFSQEYEFIEGESEASGRHEFSPDP